MDKQVVHSPPVITLLLLAIKLLLDLPYQMIKGRSGRRTPQTSLSMTADRP